MWSLKKQANRKITVHCDVGNIGDKITNTGASNDSITITNCGGGDTLTNTDSDGDMITNTNKDGDWIPNTAGSSSIQPSDVVGKTVTDKQKGKGLKRNTQSKTTSTNSTKRMHDLDCSIHELEQHEEIDSGARNAIKLNQASRPSGRPKQQKSFKTAKRKREIEGALAFVDTIGMLVMLHWKNLTKSCGVILYRLTFWGCAGSNSSYV
ncbi:hypothetical protein L917_04459 [Phytophthora nicotianae]|uniref:Uncharacterized protein n=1 Tax=Phytophthora nicotianae TaxID=4792 RepID=W2LM44_PHYNI|nr:hypothetical protein L917_04459 [Phytophthora nicotianae]